MLPGYGGVATRKGGMQSIHGIGHSCNFSENRRTSYKDVRSRCVGQRCGFLIHASVHLQLTATMKVVDHFSNTSDLRQCAVQEVLMSEAGIDRHDHNLVQVRQDLFQHGCRELRD